ncbi:DNA polymerase III PolC-type [Vibrio aerogenes CECT 7868]|uniref:DNA polymerase III PolC-type n=1 Tax=Vibrio aerogenes CECT 7868 TaxID=1216006 RepID=A0A1M5Y141_9VIBR|nr:3'-5' exonuclease [Vibrio aerogenes]SHI05659.1 DNA polymerase III PolC-type [Vibrio aerogenes CECT 7868]
MLSKIMSPPAIDWQSKFRRRLELVQNEALKRYYAAGIPEPDTPVEDVTFLAMDFETTGLDPQDNDIITIGTVPFNLNRIWIGQAKQWIVNPRKQLEEESVVIHGITHSDILHAPDLSLVYQEVLAQMAGKIMVVHYQKIEREFFDRALQLRIAEGIEFPLIDTMRVETQIQQKRNGGILKRLRGYKPESVRLGLSRSRYGLPLYTPHHALTDAVATAELFQAQIAHHYDRTIPIRQFWE